VAIDFLPAQRLGLGEYIREGLSRREREVRREDGAKYDALVKRLNIKTE
jgi:hypothetical protein